MAQITEPVQTAYIKNKDSLNSAYYYFYFFKFVSQHPTTINNIKLNQLLKTTYFWLPFKLQAKSQNYKLKLPIFMYLSFSLHFFC